jgi:hypothetical protein
MTYRSSKRPIKPNAGAPAGHGMLRREVHLCAKSRGHVEVDGGDRVDGDFHWETDTGYFHASLDSYIPRACSPKSDFLCTVTTDDLKSHRTAHPTRPRAPSSASIRLSHIFSRAAYSMHLASQSSWFWVTSDWSFRSRTNQPSPSATTVSPKDVANGESEHNRPPVVSHQCGEVAAQSPVA